MKQKYDLIPFICGAGATTAGCERGPVDLQQHGLLEELSGQGYDVRWADDPAALYDGPMGKAAHEGLPPPGSAERKDIVMWHCRYLRDRVAASIAEGRVPVTIGGDHAMGAGSVAGLAQARNAHGRIGIVWIDAHADINTPDTSPSGSLHGMPVAALLGMGDNDFRSLGGDQPVLRPDHICYFGLRDVDPEEQAYIDAHNIASYSMADIRQKGVAETFTQALQELAGKVDYLALSLDLDAFDPAEARSVGTPVEGGFTSAELFPVLRQIVHDYHFDLIELTEYNPSLPGHEPTRDLACKSLAALLRTA